MSIDYFTNARATTLATTYNAVLSSSTTVTFTASTKYIEVTAIVKGIFMKWNGAASSSSFDEFVGVGLTRQYIIPNGVLSADFIEQSASATVVVIEK